MEQILKIFFILFFILIFISSLKAQQNIIGTWHIDKENIQTTMTFYDDNTVEFSGKTGYWDIVDDLLILVVDGSQASYTWVIRDTMLTLVHTESGKTLSLKKQVAFSKR